MLEYFTTTVSINELQGVLDRRGRDGWRLHTCIPHPTASVVFIVMERAGQSQPTKRDNNEPLTAMAMK